MTRNKQKRSLVDEERTEALKKPFNNQKFYTNQYGKRYEFLDNVRNEENLANLLKENFLGRCNKNQTTVNYRCKCSKASSHGHYNCQFRAVYVKEHFALYTHGAHDHSIAEAGSFQFYFMKSIIF